VVVGLESTAERSDSFFDQQPLGRRLRERAWFFGEEIYWRCLPGETGDWSVQDVLIETVGYALNGVSIVTERPAGVEGRNEIDLDGLRFLAKRTRFIAVEIFDGESFAVWRPA
jgi:hypothetical protein